MPMAAMAESEEGAGMGGGEMQLVEPTVRSKFADTALWVGNLTTAADGTAEVALDMPENLTTWRIKVWGMGQGTKVGQGQTDVVTRKDLMVRVEMPRFYREGDEGLLQAVVGGKRPFFSKVQGASEETARALAAAGGLGAGYEVVRTLGQGGMGVVYEAMDKALERRVAVKKMRDEIRLDERERARFLQEARIPMSINGLRGND